MTPPVRPQEPERLYVRLDGDPLYAPETSVPAGALREFPVPPQLRRWIAHVIAYDERLPRPVQERIVPDGSLHLIFELASDPMLSRVAGAGLRPALIEMDGHAHALSIKLRPGAARALFGASAHELAGRAVAWDDLVGARERRLPERLREAGSEQARLAILAAALHRLQREDEGGGWLQARRAKELLRASERRPVQAAARAVGLSERRLQQLFQAHVGLSPNEWRRLSRLHECLRRLRAGGPVCWASLALECGFSDQSHLSREFRALCGYTPAQFLRQRCVSGSFKTAG